MKKLLAAAFFAAMVSVFVADAQTTGQKVKKAVKSAANETGEVASKGYSKVKDKTYKSKAGPQGQTIYIDKYSHYYYVNEKGRKVYLKESQLKNKVS